MEIRRVDVPKPLVGEPRALAGVLACVETRLGVVGKAARAATQQSSSSHTLFTLLSNSSVVDNVVLTHRFIRTPSASSQWRVLPLKELRYAKYPRPCAITA